MSRRLPWSLLVAALVLNAMYAAVGSVLVPALLAEADAARKETNLAIVMGCSSLLTLVVHPWVGAWSDRSDLRGGRRHPFIVVGAIGSGTAIALLGHAESVLAVGLGWLVVQPLLNVVEAPLDAVLADRVPRSRQQRTSAFFSGGAAVGLALGAVVAGATVGTPTTLAAGLAVALVLTMLAFVLLNPDRSRAPSRHAVPWATAWRSLDLRLVFVGRLLLILGNQLVLGYLLYIVMDRTGGSAADAGRAVSALVALHVVAIVVGAFLSGLWSRGRSLTSAVVAATWVVALGLLLALLTPGTTGLFVYAVVSGLGRGAYLTSDLALMLRVLPSSADHGRDLGLLGLATILPQTLAPALAGVLLAVTGNSYPVLFGAALVLVVASVPVVAAVSSSGRRHS